MKVIQQVIEKKDYKNNPIAVSMTVNDAKQIELNGENDCQVIDIPKNGKIKSIEDLAKTLDIYRDQGKKIVYCHGVFDLLHIGHIRYFEQASRMGDILIVTVTTDCHVDKGPHRPVFPETLRAEAIASLNCVDFVAINPWPTAVKTLKLLRPNIYVKGSEFKKTGLDITGKIEEEKHVVREINASLFFTDDIVFSSTNLINRYLSNLPNEINKYLELFRNRYDLIDILDALEKMSSMNVLVIGDTILDEYQYCNAIGKSSKDPILALKYKSHDLFAGGVLAVANHVANFVNSVQLVSVIGERESHEKFILSQLHPKVSPNFYVQPKAPTLLKRRFIDSYSFNKLLEVYVMDDSGLPLKKNLEACHHLKELLPKYDVVIAADYGHGAISDKMVKVLCDHSNFLCVNTQANAGNRGFHKISRYPRSDFVSIAEHEFEIESSSVNGNLRPKMRKLVKKVGCRQLAVTLGRKGCAICDHDGSFIMVPSFAHKTIDRIGAGDAFLSVTSLAAANGVPNEIIGFLGNVVGALAVEIIGNKKAIEKLSVKKYITSLMK